MFVVIVLIITDQGLVNFLTYSIFHSDGHHLKVFIAGNYPTLSIFFNEDNWNKASDVD